MTESSGDWRPKFLRSLSFKPRKPSIDQERRKQLISESLWPTTLDRESFKAAAILRSFCRDGAYDDESRYSSATTTQKHEPRKELKKIPAEIINKAQGLLIFNILRAGLWESGAGGSGVVFARLKDGSWSSPAAVKISTPEVGVVLGVDIFDCVLVLNSQQTLDTIKKGFCLVGRDLYSVTGPLDVGWFLEADDRARNAPIFSYFRSQQYYNNVQAENFAINARDEENQNFYSPQKLSLTDILAGQARSPPATINGLLECLKLADGETNINESVINKQAPPSDFSMIEEGQAFAIPDVEDPDQYGYAALEKYGIVVVDAATKSPVSAEEFEFHPSMKSPAFEKYHRKGDTTSIGGRSSWRQSTLGSIDRHDAGSTRSRNSIQDSSAPTSPPAMSPAAGQPIQLEDNDEEPTVKHTANGDLYSSGSRLSGEGITESKAEGARSNRASMKTVAKSSAIPEDVIEDASASDEVVATAVPTADNGSHAVDSTPALSVPATHTEAAVSNEASADQDLSPNADGKDSAKARADADADDDDDQVEVNGEEDSDTFEDLDEDFEIHDASASQPATINQGAATSVSLSQAKVVNVAKASTPSLPVRNPGRLTMVSPPSSAQSLNGEAEREPADEKGETKDAETSGTVSPVSSQQEPQDIPRSRSASPAKTQENEEAEAVTSLAGLRQGLGTPSPQGSPER